MRDGVGVALRQAHDASRRMAGDAVAARIDRDVVAGDEIDGFFFLAHDEVLHGGLSRARDGASEFSAAIEKAEAEMKGGKKTAPAELSSARRINSP